MRTCSCGDPVENGRDYCAWCSALQTLGLDSSATANEIKEAYYTLVKVWHPDRLQDDKNLREAATARLKAVNAAHDLLTSKTRKRTIPGARPSTPPRASTGARRARRAAPSPRFALRMPSLTRLLGFAVLACGLLITVLFVKAADSYLAAQPVTGRFYTELRSSILSNFHAAARDLWSQTGQSLRDLAPQKAAAASVTAAPLPDAAAGDSAAVINADFPDNHANRAQSLHRRDLGAAHAEVVRLTPYITTGLTQDEVKAILGAPTQASQDKLIYGASELDFADGKLAGWKIDPASAPIRVKLWPDAPVSPYLESFHVGSSKSAVLAVQGTPTFLSENEFGYGGSVVYFRDDRVVSWKNDSSSVPLRVAP